MSESIYRINQINFTDDTNIIYQINDATGDNSFAYGDNLKATGDNQAVFGKYNEDKPEASFIVGNGSSDNNRKNLIEISEDSVQLGEAVKVEKTNNDIYKISLGSLVVDGDTVKIGNKNVATQDDFGNTTIEAAQLANKTSFSVDLKSQGTVDYQGRADQKNIKIPLSTNTVLGLKNGGTGKNCTNLNDLKNYLGIKEVPNEAQHLASQKYYSNDTVNKPGYIKFAKITLKEYVNSPVEFTIFKRNLYFPLKVILKAANYSQEALTNLKNTDIKNDFTLQVFTYDGINRIGDTKIALTKEIENEKVIYYLALYSEVNANTNSTFRVYHDIDTGLGIEYLPESTNGTTTKIYSEGEITQTGKTKYIIKEAELVLTNAFKNLRKESLTVGSDAYPDTCDLEFGINMKNSDIIQANGIWFRDTANSAGEGIHFPRTSENIEKWDTIYAGEGKLIFVPNRPTWEKGTGYEVYHSGSVIPLKNGGTGSTSGLQGASENSIIIKKTKDSSGKNNPHLGYIEPSGGALHYLSTDKTLKFGSLPISCGGTGATTALAARKALGCTKTVMLSTEKISKDTSSGAVTSKNIYVPNDCGKIKSIFINAKRNNYTNSTIYLPSGTDDENKDISITISGTSTKTNFKINHTSHKITLTAGSNYDVSFDLIITTE